MFFSVFGADALVNAGAELSFVTFTSHRLVAVPLHAINVWRSAWPKLSARWRRAAPGVQYVYTGELGKLGRFHVHLITSATLPTRWYKDNAAETGLGYIAKAIPISDAKECGPYIGKYLGKAIAVKHWPRYWRRINTSRGWPKPKEPETPYEWVNMGNDEVRILFAIANYERHGWVVSHNFK